MTNRDELHDLFVIIDNTPMTQYEAVNYLEIHFGQFFVNLKKEIIKPIKEIEIWKIFRIEESSSKIHLNPELISEFVSLIIYKKLDQYRLQEKLKRQDKDEYINHLYKLLFIIPSSYRFIIKRRLTIPFVKKSDLPKFPRLKGRYTSTRNQITEQFEHIPIKLSHLDESEFFDKIILEMETDLTEICRMDTLAEVRRFLQNALMGFADRVVDLYIGEEMDSYKDHFIEVFSKPILNLFEFAYGVSLTHFRSSVKRPHSTHFTSAKETVSVNSGVSVYGSVSKIHHLLISFKRARIYNRKNHNEPDEHFFKFANDKDLVREIVSNMFISNQKYALLSNIESTVFYKLSLPQENDSKLLNLEYTTIKNCRFDFEHYSSSPQNYLETTTLIAAILYDLIIINEDHDLESHMGDLFNSLRISDDEVEERKKDELLSEHKNITPKTPTTENSSLVDDLDWNFVEIKKDEDWFTEVRNPEKGKFLSNIIEVSKDTFKDIFRPNSSEIKILDQTSLDSVIIKLYDNQTLNEYFYYHGQERKGYKTPKIFKKHTIEKYYQTEVMINKFILTHNLSTTSPDYQINSPKIIKFGSLYQKNKWAARYIVFEKIPSLKPPTKEVHIQAARIEVEKLHKYLKIAHKDIAIRNMRVEDDEKLWIFDYDRASFLKDGQDTYEWDQECLDEIEKRLDE